jgi:hypothetical protein
MDTSSSIGFWADVGGSFVNQCHATSRSSSGASYLAAFTDCIAAYIDTITRRKYVSVTGVSSTGLTLTVYSPTYDSNYKRRLHWLLFGGDIEVSCGRVLIPNNETWNPITATGAGFDVLFSSWVSTQSSTVSHRPGGQITLCTAHHDKMAGVYRYTTNDIVKDGVGTDLHEVGSGTTAKIYFNSTGDYYVTIANTNNNNDITITRNYPISMGACTFSYLSLKNIPAWSDRFMINNSTSSEESKTYTLPTSSSFFMAITSAWDSNTYYTRNVSAGTSAILYDASSGSQAFSITKYGNSIYDYSSQNMCYIVPRISGSYNINHSYWKFLNYNNNVWSYATKAPSGGLYTPVFILGLGEPAVVIGVPSNSQKTLTRRITRRRTYTVSSNWNALLSVVTPFKQTLTVVSNGLVALRKALSRSLASSSVQASTLRRRRFRELITSNSYVTSLKLLTKKLLHAVSDYFVFIRLPLNTSQTLIAASNSLASLFKKLFVPLTAESEHESLIEKTILLVLRAFSSWLAWIEFMVFKVLEVITDTRNDLEREVTNLFRSYEQELSAISSSVSEVAKTFFQELLAGVFQWARMERIRGPVFALRSWLWRVGRRKHGCQ